MALEKLKVNYELDKDFFKYALTTKGLTMKKLAELLELPDWRLWRVIRQDTIDIKEILAILDVTGMKFEKLFKPLNKQIVNDKEK
jgi:hypothetical protein